MGRRDRRAGAMPGPSPRLMLASSCGPAAATSEAAVACARRVWIRCLAGTGGLRRAHLSVRHFRRLQQLRRGTGSASQRSAIPAPGGVSRTPLCPRMRRPPSEGRVEGGDRVPLYSSPQHTTLPGIAARTDGGSWAAPEVGISWPLGGATSAGRGVGNSSWPACDVGISWPGTRSGPGLRPDRA